MSQFELKIESQPLFVVSVADGTDSASEPYSLEIDTSNITMFTLTIGEIGSGSGTGLPGPTGPMGPPGPPGPAGINGTNGVDDWVS